MKIIEKKGQVRKTTAEAYQDGMISVYTMTMEELRETREQIAHRIQLIQFLEQMQYCKVEMLPDCIMGTFVVPDKKDLIKGRSRVGYYLDGTQVCFIGEPEVTDAILDLLEKQGTDGAQTTVTLLADYVNSLFREEVPFLQHFEEKLSMIEEGLLEHIPKNFYQTVIRYRKELLTLHAYYEQLINVTDVIHTNRNGMLSEAEMARFEAFEGRADRLHGHVEMLREYVLQIRDMYQGQIDISQNRAMNLLTVVTSLFLPMSILVGWYGMNFTNMPELSWEYSYLVLIVVCAVILVAEIRYFRKKGLL